MIIFDEPYKTTAIQRFLLQKQISYSSYVVKQSHKNRFAILGSKMWNDLPLERKSNPRINLNVFAKKIKQILRFKQ